MIGSTILDAARTSRWPLKLERESEGERIPFPTPPEQFGPIPTGAGNPGMNFNPDQRTNAVLFIKGDDCSFVRSSLIRS